MIDTNAANCEHRNAHKSRKGIRLHAEKKEKKKEFVFLPKKKKKDEGSAGVTIEILRGAANFNEMNRERTSIVGISSAPYRSATPSAASLDSYRRRASTTFTVNFSRCLESIYRTHSYPAIAIEVTRI